MEQRIVRSIGSLLVAGLGVVLASSSACSEPVALGGFAPDTDAAAPPLSDGGVVVPDANEFRPLCKATKCPAPYATCSTDSFRCETNFDSDNDNCGACGVACPQGEDVRTLFGAEWFCQSGTCRMACDPRTRLADCNNDVVDGCETNLYCDSNNCGACGLKCPDGLTCIKGNCGCAPGLTACGDTACDAQCFNLATNDFNCGTCGHECPFDETPPYPNMRHGCGDSECGKLKCEGGFQDCNHDVELDGCEINVYEDPQNCGVCGKACAPGQFCEFGSCKCAAGETACKVNFGNPLCANLENDPQNCGACGNFCPSPQDGSAKAVCRFGNCALECALGYADCDGRTDNGCETNIASDPRNCGGCGVQCDLALGQPCVNSACLLGPCNIGETQ